MTQISKAQAFREASFGFLTQTLARVFDSKMRAELKKAGIDHRVFANLMMLSEEDGINQRQLGKALKFPEYSVSRNLDIMVSLGLAERRPDPDSRRAFLVYLTDSGRETAQRLPEIITRINDEVLEGLDAQERQQVIGLLRRVMKPGLENMS